MRIARLPAILLWVLVAALPAPPARARIIDGVVAVVGEEPVTFSEVRDAAAEGLGIPVGDADHYLRGEKDTQRVLHWVETLVEMVLVRRELTKIGQAIPDSEILRAVESVRKINNFTEAQLIEALAKEGMTPEAYRKRIRWQMERGAIVRAKKFKEVSVTDEEVRVFYRENVERFSEGGEIRLLTLNLPLPPAEGDVEPTVRLRIAATQATEHVRSGRTLPEVAELLSKSIPRAAVVASDFVKTADLMPEIQKEVQRLRTGETSPPFFTGNGAYLVHVKERRGGTPPEFAKMKNALTEELADRNSEKAYVDILAELKKAATIDIRL